MMKLLSKYTFQLLTSLLLIIAVWGVLEKQSLEFVTEISEKNVSFLALISEINLVFSSLSEVNIPFVSGSSEGLSASMDKAQNYLIITNIISFIQLLLLSICKSWIIKVAMIALWLSSFFQKLQPLSKKILILALAINPGLSIYSIAVQEISKEVSIDFGDEYLSELKTKVEAIKAEKSDLMEEHQQELSKIDQNGKHKVWSKLKSDITYDFKKTGLSIQGDYKNIRLLIHDAGHTIFKKVITFCTMILFCLLLLPIGYTVLVYTLYKSLFHQNIAIMDGLEHLASNKIDEADQYLENDIQSLEPEKDTKQANLNNDEEENKPPPPTIHL